MIDKRKGTTKQPAPSKPTVLPTSQELEKARKRQPGKTER